MRQLVRRELPPPHLEEEHKLDRPRGQEELVKRIFVAVAARAQKDSIWGAKKRKRSQLAQHQAP
jgi:hypothetical protein